MGARQAQLETIRRMLLPQIQVMLVENNDARMCDCGLTFAVNDSGSVRGIDWMFNAWGCLE